MIQKISLLLTFFKIIETKSMEKSNFINNFAFIGDYCAPEKFLKVPCLEDFCSEINQSVQIWAKDRNSIESKFTDL